MFRSGYWSSQGNNMKCLSIVFAAMALSACASDSSRGDYSLGGGTGTARANQSERTFHCPDSPIDCRKMAKDYCGNAGYTRLLQPGRPDRGDRGATGHLGTGTSNADNVRRRVAAAGAGDDSWTVRCKS